MSFEDDEDLEEWDLGFHRIVVDDGLKLGATNRNHLVRAFSLFGEVTDAQIFDGSVYDSTRRLGIVTFKDKESMMNAIEEMNSEKLDGRKLDAIMLMNGHEIDDEDARKMSWPIPKVSRHDADTMVTVLPYVCQFLESIVDKQNLS